jgi:putative heme-binding domain-containing protein
MYRLSLLTFAFFLLPCSAFAQRNAAVPDPDPELERKTFVLPDGFEVSLYAADPMLAKPIQMNFDSKGRLWIAASEVYPQIKPGQKADDKILVLEDTDGDGKADKTTVFADGLLIPTAVEPDQFGGAWVANSTELVHYSAPDPKTGKATKSRVVLSGFGTEDTHHILHTFRTGPDCRLFMSQSIYIHSHIETPHGVKRLNAGGIWRFQPQTEQLEVFARGWVNTWGTAWNRWGATFATDGAGGEGINYVVPGGAYVTARDVARILPGLNPGSPKYCGLEIVGGRHLPDDWQDNLITNDFRGHRVCRYIVKEDGSGFVSKEQKELIKSTHPAFRPIDVKMGPDGAIYIADWYNPIIQHGEVDFRDERRDKTHGRIWRITAKGRPLVEKPKISGAKIEDLLELLKAPEQWTRYHARRELATHPAAEVYAKHRDWSIRQSGDALLLESLWLLQSLNLVDIDAFNKCLRSANADVRAAACRVGADWATRHTDVPVALSLAAKDENPRVRLEAVRALTQTPAESERVRSYEAIAQALDLPVDRWLDYAIWLSLRETKDQWLPKVKDGSFNFGGDPKKLAFALRAAGENDVSGPLVAMLNSAKTTPEEVDNILITLAQTGGSKDIAIVLEKANSPARRAKLYPLIEQSVRARKIASPGSKADALGAILEGESGPARQAAARLIGLWKLEGSRPALEKLALGNKLAAESTPEDRAAAGQGLVLLGGKKSIEFFSKPQSETPEFLRLSVVSLVQLDPDAAAASLTNYLKVPNQTASEIESVFAAFINRKGGTPLLAKSLANMKLSPDVAKVGIRAAKANGQPDTALIAALTKAGGLDEKKPFTPQRIADILKMAKETGDVERGERIYRRAEMNCLKCHAVAGAGGQVGPDMTSIGASAQPDYLLESLLNPNAKIKEGYNSFIITTIDDKIITGIKVRETKEEMVVRDAEDREIAISKADKPDVKPGRSLMPEGLTEALTDAELADLVRFLSELGKGKYLAQPGRVIRRWQAVQPTKEFYTVIFRDRVAAIASNPELQWTSVYATVQGDLPGGDLPTFRKGKDGALQAAVRFQFDVTSPGKVTLKLADATGLQLWLDGNPIEPAGSVVLDVRPGLHTVTVLGDLDTRKAPIRAELEEAPESQVRFRIIGGK